MEYELVRTLLHKTQRSMFARVQTDPSQEGQYRVDMQLGTLQNSVERLAKQQGHINNDASLNEQDKRFIVQTLWELVIHGILTPTQDNGNSGWPSVSLTEHGKKVIAEEEYSPYDPAGYLTQIKSDVGGLDSIVAFYIEETLGCFRANQYVASTVMLGVASERLFDILLDSFAGSLSSEQERRQLRQKTQGRMVTQRYDELKRRIDPKKSQLPRELADNLDTSLVSIFNLVRHSRNDAGHPTGRAIRRDEAYANLYVFPHYCKYMHQLINHLQANPNSLS